MPAKFITLTSPRKTGILLRRECIMAIEGFTFAADHKHCPNHEGAIVTLAYGQWGETFHVLETPDTITKDL